MKHLKAAIAALPEKLREFFSVKETKTKGQSSLKVLIQSAPVGEVGITGAQATDLLLLSKNLLESLNSAFPCIENVNSIEYINAALAEQEVRTEKRKAAGVEGKQEAIPAKTLEEALEQQKLDDKYQKKAEDIDVVDPETVNPQANSED